MDMNAGGGGGGTIDVTSPGDGDWRMRWLNV
jgi:hypothetical protein